MNKSIKAKDFSSFSVEKLEQEITIYKKALFELRLALVCNDNKNTSLFKKHKKNIAKLKTIINQRTKQSS